ncbi:MAG: GNAT family N-acetyltransferase [Candidatus Rokuibacteriota bacterium]
MSELRLRLASEADAEAICRIYNQGIEDRLATLETELRTTEERRSWLASRGLRHPVIVAESIGAGTVGAGTASPARTVGGLLQAVPGSVPATTVCASARPIPTIIAWGSLNVFNPREAYRFVADFSVYVERAWRGQGVGSLLLERLIDLARQHGFHKMVLSAFPSNTSGVALYEKFGFRAVGIYHEQGLLDGAWVDTLVMEKLLL